MDRWETRLATRDSNRVVRPFEWGLEWLDLEENKADPASCVGSYAKRAIEESDRFFAYQTPSDYRFSANVLTFTSPLPSGYSENDQVTADYFPSSKSRGRAVVVLPQWNADEQGHVGLCKLMNHFGLSALRMSMPYHDRRMPPELERADYHVSSNIGRTIHACRQAAIDARACLDWLEQKGYSRLGVLGTSLGSCIAFLVAAHDARVRAGAFNHVSTNFGDVVWTGLSTRHVREGLEGHVTQEQLHLYWSMISPASYVGRMTTREMKSLLIWTKYDTTFLPKFSWELVNAYRSHDVPHRALSLPCAHYTLGQPPFNLIDGLSMCGFLRKNL